MVGASKILTVSYGTFSCTLEGFDEPFNTMKAIAEYFRDLAAEDRYFGAEPPQPDAEMLHRIAEREMARRVEAKIQKNGVILRPGDALAGPETATDSAAAAAAATGSAATDPQPAPQPVMQPPAPALPATAAPVIAAQPEAVSDPISESVAAKLQRIRSAVAQARAAQAEPEPEPEADPALAPAEAPAVVAPEDFGFALDISGPLSADEAEDILSDTSSDDENAEGDESAAPTAPMDPEKAERMRRRAERRAARLLQAETPAPAPLHATPSETPDIVATEIVAAAQPEGQTDTSAKSPPPVDSAEPTETAPMDAAPIEAGSVAAAPAETPRPVIRARVIKLRRAEPAAAAPAATPETAAAEDAGDEVARMIAAVSATVAEPAQTEAETTPEPVPLTAEADAELMAELAALTENLGAVDWGIEGWVDARSAPEENAPADFPPADLAPEAPPSEEVAPVEAAFETAALVVPLDPAPKDAEEAAEVIEAEAAAPISAEIDLEALFAETAPEPDTAPAPITDTAPAPITVPEPAPVLVLPPDDLPPGFVDRRAHPTEPVVMPVRTAEVVRPLPEGDLPRLLEKADAQMAGNENRRRISAIAHLKAAVAATVAERRAGSEGVEKDETAPYRQDLTQAVRPRRPVLPSVGESHHQTAARPEARPAPLVLVSEQRVDRAPAEAVAKAQAIRPRRISTTNLAQDSAAPDSAADDLDLPLSPEEASSFAEFAQSRAPQGLAELLEAAAAYTAQVEGRPHFSPPQILNKVSAVGDASFSREDRLRMFGTLLRQGKIAKVKRGQYAITEASRFFKARA